MTQFITLALAAMLVKRTLATDLSVFVVGGVVVAALATARCANDLWRERADTSDTHVAGALVIVFAQLRVVLCNAFVIDALVAAL